MTLKSSKPVYKPSASLPVRLEQFSFKLLGNYFPSIMSRRALKRWSKTQPTPVSTQERRMQLRGEEYVLEVNGQQIKTWTWGSGKAILLVHGWNGHGLQFTRFIDPLLNAGYQVISFDAPAHGQSTGHRTHLLEIRDVILAVAERHGPIHAAIAHSFGVACLSAAINAGLSVACITAISSPGGLSNLIQRYCQYMQIPPATEEKLRQRLSRRLGQTLWEQFAESYPITADVSRSLIIHDKEDRLVNWQESERLAEQWPNAERLYTEGLGHQRILFDRTTIQQIADFIDNTVVCDSLENT